MSLKTERISSMLVKEISDVIQNEMNDKDVRFVSITACKVDTDLSLAQIYCIAMDEKNKEKCIHDLNVAKGYIKKCLAKRKLEIRKIPDLRFIYDDSIEYGSKIENILKDIKEESE